MAVPGFTTGGLFYVLERSKVGFPFSTSVLSFGISRKGFMKIPDREYLELWVSASTNILAGMYNSVPDDAHLNPDCSCKIHCAVRVSRSVLDALNVEPTTPIPIPP